MSLAVDVVDDTERAQVLLHPARLRLLEHLEEPRSAAAIARRVDMPRQRINYHLRALEKRGLIRLVEERRKGSVTERIYGRTGQAYAISTAALGKLGSSPEDFQDRFSSAYQVALASQAVADLGALQVAAAKANKKLATMAMETRVRFASAATREAFATELTEAVAQLVEKYHDEEAARGRWFQFYLGAYPGAKRPAPESEAPSEE